MTLLSFFLELSYFPLGALLRAIEAEFGSFDEFKAAFTAKTVGIQGSGWGWLGFNPSTKRVEIATCANQDPLQATTGDDFLSVQISFKRGARRLT